MEQDRLRRAKKRDDQLRDAGKGRFKETLSPLEKRRAAERERIKGNESFKVGDIVLVGFTLTSGTFWGDDLLAILLLPKQKMPCKLLESARATNVVATV